MLGEDVVHGSPGARRWRTRPHALSALQGCGLLEGRRILPRCDAARHDLGAWALLALVRRAAGVGGNARTALSDAQVAAPRPRLVLHPEERYAPTSADELLALGATLVRRDGSLARAAPLAPASCPRQQLRAAACPARTRCGSAADWSRADRVRRPSTRPRLDIRARRATPSGQGQRARLAREPGSAHAVSRARGRRAVLVLLARRRLALEASHACAVPGAGTVRMPVIHQHHEGDWEAVTVGLVGRPPAVRRLERALRGRVAAVRGRDARRRCRRRGARTRSRGSRSARTPTCRPRRPRDRAGGAATRASPRSSTSACESVIGPVAEPGARQPSGRRARDRRPRGQRRAAGVPAGARQPASRGR